MTFMTIFSTSFFLAGDYLNDRLVPLTLKFPDLKLPDVGTPSLLLTLQSKGGK